ncbi:MAG: serine/threonine-protein kinase [Acidobacteriota bacterium]
MASDHDASGPGKDSQEPQELGAPSSGRAGDPLGSTGRDRGEPDDGAPRLADVDANLDRALDLVDGERAKFLASLPASMRRAVEELLHSIEAGGPLDLELAAVAPGLLEMASGDRGGSRGAAAEATGPDDPPGQLGRVIGPWQIVERLGAGGMGVVYRVRRIHEDFEQEAALKVIRWEFADDLLVRRFLKERRILAHLSHPHIAALIDGGVDGGLPFLVLEFVDGRPIDDFCSEQDLDRESRVRLLETVAGAVDFAHRQLVIHRDLKPSNILVRADGVPKLVDFGVAQLVDGTGGETTRFAPVTPGYSAPEQRGGEPVGVAADVWSLGVVLAQVLTGEEPHRNRPDQIPGRSGLTGDLANIVDRATAADPEDRYRSAGAFADDLRKWLAGEPVMATAPTLRYRWGKWFRRHAAAVIAASAVGLAGLGGVVWQGLEARQERDRARLEAAKAEEISNFMLELFRQSSPRLGDEPTARSLLDQGAEQVRNRLQDAPLQRMEILASLGHAYRWLGEHDSAEDLLTEALSIKEAEGPGDEKHAELVAGLAAAAAARNDLDEAERLYRRALAILDQAGIDNVSRRSSMVCGLGIILHRRGDSAASVEKLEQALALAQEAQDTGILAMVYGNLGLAYDGLGRFREGEEAHRQSAVLYRSHDPQNSTISDVLNNLGNSLLLQGRTDEAMEVLRESLAFRRATHAPGVGLAESEANFAALLIAEGRSAEALKLAENAAKILVEAAPESPNTLFTRANLGWAAALDGQAERGGEVLRQVVDDLVERFGAEHRLVTRGRTRYGAALHRAGRNTLAIEQLSAAVDGLRTLGVEGLTLADALLPLGSAACDGGRFDEGLAALEKAESLFSDGLSGPSWRTAAATVERARCQVAAGGEPVEVKEALEILVEKRGVESWDVKRVAALP